jgi:RNA polymerase sigma-70 factor (ECF subfamily)
MSSAVETRNPVALKDLSEDELFSDIVRRRAERADVNAPLGELVRRWRDPALYVIRRIQRSYRRGTSDDELEIFQEAVVKFVDKGLDQFRGISEQQPGRAASPKTFFLRIAKHVAIDRYRRQREQLASPPEDGEEGPEEAPAQVSQAVERARQAEEAAGASETYWAAFRRLEEEHPKEAAAWDLYHHQDVDDHEACAAQLGITVANSYKRVSRAQAYLKLYLLEQRENEP